MYAIAHSQKRRARTTWKGGATESPAKPREGKGSLGKKKSKAEGLAGRREAKKTQGVSPPRTYLRKEGKEKGEFRGHMHRFTGTGEKERGARKQ